MGATVQVQDPNRGGKRGQWTYSGIVVEVLPFNAYNVRMTHTRQVTYGNRGMLRPIPSELVDLPCSLPPLPLQAWETRSSSQQAAPEDPIKVPEVVTRRVERILGIKITGSQVPAPSVSRAAPSASEAVISAPQTSYTGCRPEGGDYRDGYTRTDLSSQIPDQVDLQKLKEAAKVRRENPLVDLRILEEKEKLGEFLVMEFE